MRQTSFRPLRHFDPSATPTHAPLTPHSSCTMHAFAPFATVAVPAPTLTPGTARTLAAAAVLRLIPSAVACAAYFFIRRRLTGEDTLVRIYRKVENPIAFSSDPKERALSLLHLHAMYAGLAFFPARLSCDWSFACVPMVSR